MSDSSTWLGLVPLISLVLWTDIGIGDEPGSHEQLPQTFVRAAREYVILKEGSKTPLTLHETPLLKWSNPVRTKEQGVVFVWLDDGVPTVIGTLFTFVVQDEIRTKHELHSLADGPLSARFRGRDAWTPKEAGLKWNEFADLGRPAKSQGLRLAQMRRIAGRFDVRLIDRKSNHSTLRLLTQPLFRFSSAFHGVMDGAIFAYAVATDPEAMLVVRATKDAVGDRWEYAFARCHYWQLEARLNENLVWTASFDPGMETNQLGDQAHMNKPYNTFRVE